MADPLLEQMPGGIRINTRSNKGSPIASPLSSAPGSPALEHMLALENSDGNGFSGASSTSGPQINNQDSGVENRSEVNNDMPENIRTNSNGPMRAVSTTVPASSTAVPAPPPQVTHPPRRSSFGLNFLSSFTNSIRGNPLNGTHQPPSPSANPHAFMSNSPTIANLSNYTMTNNGESAPTVEEHEEANNNMSTSSGSELEPSSNENIPPLTNQAEDAMGLPTTQVSEDNLDESTRPFNGMDKDGYFSVRLTPLIDHSSSASGLYFAPVIRKVKQNSKISIGRYTEKNKAAAHAPQGSSAPIVFKSKVVSRTHALFQCNEDGQWFLKDCRSSSGTFLNHIRLSQASQELTLMPLIDGDIIQLGMDYRGGTEEFYRCVKMRCEFNKSWQRKVNQFNLEIHKKLKNLQISNDGLMNPLTGNAAAKDELSECAICLLKLEPCQALFISPCSHSWHYKCIRPIIIKSYPQFYCPNCRSMCDLETDIEDEDEDEG
ncbi:uncharacterized protein PRCAT00003191001 [Priceomyces carsonii]|uniref:uncharacterized protein n=1 Tax=Priceomyces carsonii TaxID=28549 RepID=UPI002EDA45B0|nr:unnamed protein product [Priceomyces carsonii]